VGSEVFQFDPKLRRGRDEDDIDQQVAAVEARAKSGIPQSDGRTAREGARCRTGPPTVRAINRNQLAQNRPWRSSTTRSRTSAFRTPVEGRGETEIELASDGLAVPRMRASCMSNSISMRIGKVPTIKTLLEFMPNGYKKIPLPRRPPNMTTYQLLTGPGPRFTRTALGKTLSKRPKKRPKNTVLVCRCE